MMDVRDNRRIPIVSATASKDPNGKIHISMSNVDADNAQEVTINLSGTKAKKAVGELSVSYTHLHNIIRIAPTKPNGLLSYWNPDKFTTVNVFSNFP